MDNFLCNTLHHKKKQLEETPQYATLPKKPASSLSITVNGDTRADLIAGVEAVLGDLHKSPPMKGGGRGFGDFTYKFLIRGPAESERMEDE